jgi:RNA polymerase sigma-70 factor, ECF subfamily
MPNSVADARAAERLSRWWCERPWAAMNRRPQSASAASIAASTNRAQFEQHVVPEIEVLLRVAKSLCRTEADAEDLVQETLVRAYRAIDRFDGRHARAWLLTILRNTHINSHRRRRPELLDRREANSDRHEPVAADRADAAIDASFTAEVERALGELDDAFRLVVQLVDIDGLSYAEAASALGVPTGTVMSRLHRARSRVRDRLHRSGVAPRSSE